ncbi:hypothetical protein EMCG_09158 [[Emmonsia] crescens]|uniref:Uncharacterized protein n=1 Tax=[Emmonsia] crescens TaxID=73230 RepID=A0A0G2J3E6_9EURO|nr:hypothetical protein EMCG_09158 [Emmonsia crescens UAMH 3008]
MSLRRPFRRLYPSWSGSFQPPNVNYRQQRDGDKSGQKHGPKGRKNAEEYVRIQAMNIQATGIQRIKSF